MEEDFLLPILQKNCSGSLPWDKALGLLKINPTAAQELMDQPEMCAQMEFNGLVLRNENSYARFIASDLPYVFNIFQSRNPVADFKLMLKSPKYSKVHYDLLLAFKMHECEPRTAQRIINMAEIARPAWLESCLKVEEIKTLYRVEVGGFRQADRISSGEMLYAMYLLWDAGLYHQRKYEESRARFFDIMRRLNPDLQQVLCHRVFFSKRTIITHQQTMRACRDQLRF